LVPAVVVADRGFANERGGQGADHCLGQEARSDVGGPFAVLQIAGLAGGGESAEVGGDDGDAGFWARRFRVGEREGGEQAEDEHPDAEFDEGDAALGDGVRGPRTQGSGRVGRESRAMRWRWSDESFHCAAK
jgi:hypothetical protein